jgi:hypothetical protein
MRRLVSLPHGCLAELRRFESSVLQQEERLRMDWHLEELAGFGRAEDETSPAAAYRLVKTAPPFRLVAAVHSRQPQWLAAALFAVAGEISRPKRRCRTSLCSLPACHVSFLWNESMKT